MFRNIEEIDESSRAFERIAQNSASPLRSLAFGKFPTLPLPALHDRRHFGRDQTITSATGGDLPAILAAYDFSGFGRIVDVGGGQAALLRSILERCPNAIRTLCDIPPVRAQAFGDQRISRGGAL